MGVFLWGCFQELSRQGVRMSESRVRAGVWLGSAVFLCRRCAWVTTPSRYKCHAGMWHVPAFVSSFVAGRQDICMCLCTCLCVRAFPCLCECPGGRSTVCPQPRASVCVPLCLSLCVQLPHTSWACISAHASVFSARVKARAAACAHLRPWTRRCVRLLGVGAPAYACVCAACKGLRFLWNRHIAP